MHRGFETEFHVSWGCGRLYFQEMSNPGGEQRDAAQAIPPDGGVSPPEREKAMGKWRSHGEHATPRHDPLQMWQATSEGVTGMGGALVLGIGVRGFHGKRVYNWALPAISLVYKDQGTLHT